MMHLISFLLCALSSYFILTSYYSYSQLPSISHKHFPLNKHDKLISTDFSTPAVYPQLTIVILTYNSPLKLTSLLNYLTNRDNHERSAPAPWIIVGVFMY